MYYQKEILPLGDGNFLLATFFQKNKVGGECDRESRHAYFAYGHVDTPDVLTDITTLCCLERSPNGREEKRYLRQSKIQRDRVGNEETAEQYAYQAELATAKAQFVPRTALTSANGMLVVGLECTDYPGDFSVGVHRLINVFDGSVIQERRSNSGSGLKALASALLGSSMIAKGKEGFSGFQALAYPKALSPDGKLVICTNSGNPHRLDYIEVSISDNKLINSFSQLTFLTEFISTRDHWIAIDHTGLYKFRHRESSGSSELPLPLNAYTWGVAATIDAELLAIPCDSGEISIVNLSTGDTKRYFPHPGCRRDSVATIKLSDDGNWLASKIHGQTPLILTNLKQGRSWKVADIDDERVVERQDVEYRSRSHIPAAFAFIDSRLLVSETRTVKELSLQEPDNLDLIYVSEQGRPGARERPKIDADVSLKRILEQAKLQKSARQIQDVYYPACKIESEESKDADWYAPDEEGAPPLGVSRLGGWPDLPEDVSWPFWDKRPMGFIGQINLSEVADAQPDIRLPKEGVLLFFVGCSEESFEHDILGKEGYLLEIMPELDADQAKGWKVIYAEPGANLKRTVFDGDILPEIFNPCLLKIFKGGLPLPDEATALYEGFSMDDEEMDNYNDVLELLSEEDAENQLSGYPKLLQFTPLEYCCVMASANKDPFSFPDENTAEYQELIEAASGWGLLFQVTSDDNAGFLWGDAGHLYFYGKRNEMEAGVFDSCWMFFEN